MTSNSAKPPPTIKDGQYEIDKKLGAGCFGEVWLGHDTATKQPVAVKFEDIMARGPQLEHEVMVLEMLSRPSRPQGFSQCFHHGQEGRYHCMVMELLGKSLEDRMKTCNGRFNVQSAALVAEQLLTRIEYLHSKGTARYASINAHRGYEQSRRDDLEAIGHMLFYFIRGSLPWSGLAAKTQEEKYRKICEKKEETSLDELCAGFPDAFKIYLRMARGLEFKERPDYQGLRKLFRDVRNSCGPGIEDHDFQWLEGKDLGQLVPLIPNDSSLRQPDDKAPAKRTGFCFCGGKPNVRD